MSCERGVSLLGSSHWRAREVRGIDVEGEVAVVEVDNVLLWSTRCGRDDASFGSHVVVKSEMVGDAS